MATNAGPQAAARGGAPPRPGMVWIPGGTFRMGSDAFYPEERPVRQVRVDGFWIDRHSVTNQQFSRFVAATGYVSVAERRPDPALYPGAPPENLVAGSMVFSMTSGPVDLSNSANWWAWTPGASWRHPRGPDSSIEGLADHPVVQVALADVEAYCAWAEASLPTEAEWELAARGGLDGAIFTWGNEERPDGQFMANTWQGHFPWQNTHDDGYVFTSPVGSFPANGNGLLDMAGNVWEWTADWYAVARPSAPAQGCCMPHNPRGGETPPSGGDSPPGREGPGGDSSPWKGEAREGATGHGGEQEASISPHHAQFRIPRRVVKGGSHLCAPNYCFRYRPAARQPQDIDTGMSHLGFRTVVRFQPSEERL